MSDAKKPRAAPQPEHEAGEHAQREPTGGERTVPNVLGVNGPSQAAAAADVSPRRAAEGAEGSVSYPKGMWRPDGYYDTALDAAEEERMVLEGWSRSYVAPRTPQSMQGNVQSSGLDPLAMLIREVLESVLDERGLGEPKQKRAAFGTGPMQWIGARGKEKRDGAQG